MRFMLDQNVPNSVATALRELGHDVALVRELLAVDAPDPLVATTAEIEDRILVSLDRDFQRLDPQRPPGHRARFRRLSRIHLSCRPARAAERICLFIREIEWEAKMLSDRGLAKMMLTISDQFFKTAR
jgi:hypothetical protein